jgi:hypothetical protein
MLDQPPQQFFTFDADIKESQYVSPIISDGLDALLKANGFTNEMKLELFSMGRLSVMMRVENIGDIFNTNGQVTSAQVNLEQLAKDLFVMMNGENVEFVAGITELTLSGNQSYKTMAANKLKWTAVEDGVAAPYDSSDSDDLIEL